MRTVEDRKPRRKWTAKRRKLKRRPNKQRKKNYRNKSNPDEYQKSLCSQLTRTRGKACSLCTNR
jgi:hypothetical protein